MTLTVQDLVTKLGEFATDGIVRIQTDYGIFPTYVVRNIASIEKDDKGDVVLIAEIPSNPYNDHEESEGEKSEDEESEDEESEDEESEDEESEDEESEDEE